MRIVVLVIIVSWLNPLFGQGILDSMVQFPRVKAAQEEVDSTMKMLFEENQLNYPPQDIFWRCFKYEDEMELWARDSGDEVYVHVKTYAICKGSGTHGPKRQIGDAQVPEGFYNIDLYNPRSSYHLSFRVNYPNKSDSILGVKNALGGDIYVHGGCLTIGCIPLTNKYIKEVFWLSLRCQDRSEDTNYRVPIHIFPLRMTPKKMLILKNEFGYSKVKMKFWQNIYKGYAYFEQKKSLPLISINDKGEYIYEDELVIQKETHRN